MYRHDEENPNPKDMGSLIDLAWNDLRGRNSNTMANAFETAFPG